MEILDYGKGKRGSRLIRLYEDMLRNLGSVCVCCQGLHGRVNLLDLYFRQSTMTAACRMDGRVQDCKQGLLGGWHPNLDRKMLSERN